MWCEWPNREADNISKCPNINIKLEEYKNPLSNTEELPLDTRADVILSKIDANGKKFFETEGSRKDFNFIGENWDNLSQDTKTDFIEYVKDYFVGMDTLIASQVKTLTPAEKNGEMSFIVNQDEVIKYMDSDWNSYDLINKVSLTLDIGKQEG